MRIGPVEIIWSPVMSIDRYRSALVRGNLVSLLKDDPEIRKMIVKTAHAVAKDYIEERQAEEPQDLKGGAI